MKTMTYLTSNRSSKRLSILFSMVINGATAIEISKSTLWHVETVRAQIADLRSKGFAIQYNETTKEYKRG
tara:strand:+ start:30 stop:239 length:210 start_codon:yes stop_codon:yes gene_type:complete